MVNKNDSRAVGTGYYNGYHTYPHQMF